VEFAAEARVRQPDSTYVTHARPTSMSAVSRVFVDRMRDQLWRLMRRPLSDLRLAAMMLDGIDLHGNTNIVASAINRDLKNWSSGEMRLRWTAAGMVEAETRLRNVEGYRGLARLAIAIEQHLTKELATTLNV
jgi:hypothetical protein